MPRSITCTLGLVAASLSGCAPTPTQEPPAGIVVGAESMQSPQLSHEGRVRVSWHASASDSYRLSGRVQVTPDQGGER